MTPGQRGDPEWQVMLNNESSHFDFCLLYLIHKMTMSDHLWDGSCFLHRAHVLLMFLWNRMLFSTQTALPPILSSRLPPIHSSRLCSLPSKDLSSLLIANLSTEDRLPTICCISVCRLSLMSSQFSVSLLWEHSSLCVSLLGSQCRPRAQKSQIPCQQETSQSSYHDYHSNKTNKTNKTTD